MSAPAASTAGVLPECRFEVHFACKPGEVRTCYGEVVPGLTRHCACPCHTKKKRETS